MIKDEITNLTRYPTILRANEIIDFCLKNDLKTLKTGKYEILSDQLFAIVDEYNPKEEGTTNFEIHEHHADVQILINGTEKMGVGAKNLLTSEIPTELTGDIKFFNIDESKCSSLIVQEGEFAFFPPWTPHKPGLKTSPSHNAPIKKIVFKILLS